jgi:Outer membrane protein beta-barrel domain
MRKLIFLAFVLLVFKTVSIAQQAWQIGGEITPQRSVLYNWNDWNAEPWVLDPMYRNELHINSVSFGFFAAKHFNEYISLEGRLLYSAQRQDYDIKIVPDKPIATGFIEFYTKLNYLKLPVLLNIHTTSSANAFFSFSIGPQFSYLLSYYETYSQEHDEPYYSLIRRTTKGKKMYVQDISERINNPVNIDTAYNLTKRMYSDINLGVAAYIGGNFFLTDNIILQVNIRMDYEFTNTENRNAELVIEPDIYKFWFSDIKYSPYPSNEKRRITHNITWGLSIGLSVLLE